MATWMKRSKQQPSRPMCFTISACAAHTHTHTVHGWTRQCPEAKVHGVGSGECDVRVPRISACFLVARHTAQVQAHGWRCGALGADGPARHSGGLV